MAKFIKLANKQETVATSDIAREKLINSVIPFLGNYTAVDDDDHTKKKIITTLFGRSGRAGMEAKETGRSKLGDVLRSNTMFGLGSGGLIGGVAGGLSHGKKGILPGVIVGSGTGGLVSGAAGGLSYGIGHLAGDEKPKKRKRLKSSR